MNTSILITLSCAAASLLLPLMFTETLKEMIKKSFTDISPRKIRLVLFLVFGGSFLLLTSAGYSISSTITEEKDDESPFIAAEPKSDNEVIEDLVKTTIDETKNIVNNKRSRDSITLANREQIWVYRIGYPKEGESDAWDAAMAVNSLRHICIFKESRKTYSVICDPGFTEQELRDSLNIYQDKLDSTGIDERIEVINLMTYCSVKERIIETDEITKRKQDETFSCRTCDK